MASEGGQIGFAEEPEVHEVFYETPETRPVEMRNKKKNDPGYKGVFRIAITIQKENAVV